jgi:hypothetical protein
MNVNRSKDFFQWHGVGMALCGLVLVGVLLASCKSTVSPDSFPKVNGKTALSAGDVAFTGLTLNGNSQFSFVFTSDINPNVSVYFTNYTYDPNQGGFVDESTTDSASSNWPGQGTIVWHSMATTITEGTVLYTTSSSGLHAYTPIIISNTSNSSNSLQSGTVTAVDGNTGSASTPYLVFNHNGAGHKIFAYTASGGVTTFLAGLIFGPDSWTTSGTISLFNFWDSYLPTGLGSTNSTDLSSLWASGQDGNLATFNNATQQNDNTALNSCQSTLAGIVNPSNWQADGNQSKTKVDLNGIGLTACVGAGYTGLIP